MSDKRDEDDMVYRIVDVLELTIGNSNYRDIALAILKEIRRPTNAMVDAAAEFYNGNIKNQSNSLIGGYKVMIDAAMTERVR